MNLILPSIYGDSTAIDILPTARVRLDVAIARADEG
jgi:hypothetical protein